MNRFPLSSIILGVLVPAAAAAQEPPAATQPQQQYSFEFKIDALARQEWTRDIFDAPDSSHDEHRWRLRAKPRIEAGFGPVVLGLGGDFNYSSDKNNDPPPAPPTPQRDNYDSRSARLDLAFGSLRLGPLRLQGGRMALPVPLTEMLWDRDLRAQGGAATLELRDLGAVKSLSATGVYSLREHVFDVGDTTLLLLSGETTLTSPTGSELQLMASFLKFTEFDAAKPVEPMLRRQNARTAGGELAGPFEVVDLVARFRSTGQAPLQLVADYCWNRALAADNKGLWLAVVLGSILTTPARLEYTYANVDKDATLGAFANDDFFWATGWQGHRADIGIRSGEHSSIHAVGQLQRFKDSPQEAERDVWVKRLRLEARIFY